MNIKISPKGYRADQCYQKDLINLCWLTTQIPENGKVCMTGLLDGCMLTVMMGAAKQIGKSLSFVGIDNWSEFGANRETLLNNIKEFECDISILTGDAVDVLDSFPDNHFDFIFLDDCHQTDHVIKELHICQRIIKSGGTIAGHDAHDFKVIEALNQVFQTYEIASDLSQSTIWKKRIEHDL